MSAITPLQRRVLNAVACTLEEVSGHASVDLKTTRNTLAWLAAKGLVELEGDRWVRR